jgi:hypothetical protein
MIGLVHLVWAPLGPEPLRAFLRSYRAHRPGAPHELAIVLNGAQFEEPEGVSSRAALLAELHGTEHRLLELDSPMLDLAAYAEAARRLEYRRLCFLNSYSVVLADDWLGRLAQALDSPEVGLAGATGSWESRATLVNGSAMHWIYQLVKLREKRRDFPPFPNPHIRTTAFMVERELLLELGLERPSDKRTAYLLESGRRSITREVQRRGRRAVVVGRDGRSYDVEQWSCSRTFRGSGRDGQSNLLVADNRTSEWEQANPEQRRLLTHYAWEGRTWANRADPRRR